MKTFLFKQIDNSSLAIFRIFFGLLCALESFGAIITGWVTKTLVEPKFTFNFIGFDWLQPLPGNWMYVYYIIMGCFGILIMLGLKYRFSMFMFAVMWTGTYLMQKSSYNNHYYFLFILSFVMVLLPANKYASLDVKLKPSLKKLSMPNWCKWFFIIQLFILYTYASIAKIYPDWLDTTVVELLMKGKSNYPIIGDILQHKPMHYFIAYGGILFDGLIIPLLLFKPTRKIAFFISIFFHLFNSIVFQVGIFPYLSLAFSVFFFPAEEVQKLFFRNRPFYNKDAIEAPKYYNIKASVFVIYFIVHILLPLRQHTFKDNVLWTEEGHRLSWRMMLRAKSAITKFKVMDTKTNQVTNINLGDYLTKKQQQSLSSKPDMIWQFAQYLKKVYSSKNIDIKVYVTSSVSVNGKPYKKLIDPSVDLANQEWKHFKHHDWILPFN